MKNLSLLLILLCMLSGAWAMNVWPEPVKIQETDYYETNKASIVIGNHTIIVWADFRENQLALYAQKLSETGQKLWDPEGVKIAAGDANQRNHRIIASSDGGVIIVWKENYGMDFYNEPTYLMGQKLDINGNRLWSNSGKVVHSQSLPIYNMPAMFSDHNGGLYLTEFSLGYYTYNNSVTHVDSDGESTPSVSFDFTETNGQLKKAIFHSEGYFVAIYKEQGTYKMAKFDTQGNHLTNSLTLGSQINNNIILRSIDNNRTLAFWTDSNSIKAQIMNANGSAGLPANHTLFTGSPEPQLLQYESASDRSILLFNWGGNGYYIIKLDNNFIPIYTYNTDIAEGDLFQMYLTPVERNIYIFWKHQDDTLRGQKFNISFQKLWENEGRILQSHFLADEYHSARLGEAHFAFTWIDLYRDQISCNFLNQDEMTLENEPVSLYQGIITNQCSDKRVFVTSDKSFLLWENNSEFSNRIYLQIIQNSNGQVMWPQSAKRISLVSEYAYMINAKLDLQNNLVVWWQETINETNILKVQVIDQNGNFLYADEGLTIMNLGYNPDLNLENKSSIQFEGNMSYFYFTGYDDENLFEYIKGQCVQNGNVMWGEQGRVIVHKAPDPDMFSEDNIACKILDNDTQENMIFWSQGSYNNCIYMLRLNSEGQPADNQNPEGTAIFNYYPESSGNYRIYVVKQGNEYIIYSNQSAYQIINEDGTLQLPLIKRLVNVNYEDIKVFWNNGFITYYNHNTIWYKNIFTRQANDFVSILSEPVPVLIPQNYEDFNCLSFIPMHNRTLMVYNTLTALYMNVSGLNEEYLASPFCVSQYSAQSKFMLNLTHLSHTDALFNWTRYLSDSETYQFINDHYLQRISVTSFTDTDESLTIPAPVTLKQNYPNPFNPSTKIGYTLKQAGATELSVYNIKGQKVVMLVDEVMTAGNHEIVWNGKDENGASVSSGIYFYRLNAGGEHITKKMILMK